MAILLAALPLTAQEFGRPALLRNVGIDQKLDGQIPLEATFQDETGQTVRLGQYFGERPAILALVYYECPMLCNQVLNGLLHGMKSISLNAGAEYDVITVSFDPRETPKLAAAKKHAYVSRYGRAGAERGWHFLTGKDDQIHKLTEAAGFRYAFDPGTNQYAHASGILVLTPQGKIARYFYGISYPERDLRLGLVEASNNKIGTLADQVLLFCYHYDPTKGKYGLVIMNVIRAAGVLTVLALLGLLFVLFRGERSGWRTV